ncbi:MAG: alpha/beta hydrolase [Winogradskyella sp.]|uniref:alpha/beta fold hydrolase n=1 Tax=Winogradskyella sp. TaxID=1883156 RepID=UPI000F3E968B|nr:alpha/beta hydrolase [Winogradskyella sp.]RNC83564.1 MAG: alpha/beta hydrolase [Winogradskyella sp.]
MSNFIIKSIGGLLNTASYFSASYASNKALQLFATPRKGRYDEAQTAIVAPAEKLTYTYDNLNITVYNWKGSGKTVFLAHGWESNASRWSYLLDTLKEKDYNIYAIDAPVHGMSDGKEFNALLYSECINSVAKIIQPEVIIGHSVGGMATTFCLHNHDLPSVKKIALLGAPAHFTGVFSRYKSMMGYNKRISEGLDTIVVNRFGKTVDYFSAANFTKEFNMQGLIIHDKNDKIIPYEDALLYKENFKNSELITTEGFGHGLKDQSLSPKIIEFIDS